MLLNPEIWVAFLTLLALEIVLGIDNVVFISSLVDKLPEERQALARRLGLGLELVMRVLLLFCSSAGSSGSPLRSLQSWAKRSPGAT